MRIFITGSSGFIGKNLSEFYSAQNHEIYNYRRENLLDALNEFKPDIIINSAAEIYDPILMFESNIILTKICLDYTVKNKNRMIQIGSSSELGRLNKPGSETDLINPENMYAGTKGAASLLSQCYARQYNLDIAVVRPYSVYGRYERHHRLFPKLRNAFISNDEIKLSNGFHDWIYIDDFIRGIDFIINLRYNSGEIFHLGTGIQESNYAVLNQFEKFYNTFLNIQYIDQYHNYDSETWICDITKMYNLGYKTKYNLAQGIEHYLNGVI